MAHALAIVIGDDWQSQTQPHSIYREGGTEGDGQFDWCEIGGRFGQPLKLRQPQPRGLLLRFLGPKTHTTQAARSAIDINSMHEHFPFAVIAAGKWHDPESFDDARRLIEAAPGDPLLSAIDYHL